MGTNTFFGELRCISRVKQSVRWDAILGFWLGCCAVDRQPNLIVFFLPSDFC